MSMTAAATERLRRPVGRLVETPGSPPMSSRSSRAAWEPLARSSADRTRLTSGPSLARQAPQMRASERNVFAVPTEWVGRATAEEVPASWAIEVRIWLRSLRSTLSMGGPSRKCSRLSRPAPNGSDHAESGASSPPPRSRASPRRCRRPPAAQRTSRTIDDGEEGEPASPSPDSTLIPDRCASRRGQHRVAVAASRTLSGEGEDLLASCPPRAAGELDEVVSASTPVSLTVPSGSRCSASRSGSL